MGKGYLPVSGVIVDTGTPEVKGIIEGFIKQGTVISIVRNERYVDYCVDHPDFDSDTYGEDARYDLVVTTRYNGWNHNVVLKELKVWHDDKLQLVKDYRNNVT